MANILDRYGIKEVADVSFYKIDDNGGRGELALFLDTLKVSTIEQTAESTEAKGGKGNASLISWDYGKEITVTIEDALFSAKSMSVMFGDDELRNVTSCVRTLRVQAKDSSASIVGGVVKYTDMGVETDHTLTSTDTIIDAATASTPTSLVKDHEYLLTLTENRNGTEIEISANTFPGNYYIVGDTYARSEKNGKDSLFQFIIPKAKVTSENTITLEAEGDPTVFNMNLKVLRPSDGKMMKLIKYEQPNS